MHFVKEFKAFAMRGNVVDMAVGIIIGASFNKIISSLVNDVLMPPIGVLVGGVDFSNLSVTIAVATGDKPAVLLKYGQFINVFIDFLIVAMAMFIIVKSMNRLVGKKETESAAPTTKECPECKMTIPINAHKCAYCTSPLN